MKCFCDKDLKIYLIDKDRFDQVFYECVNPLCKYDNCVLIYLEKRKDQYLFCEFYFKNGSFVYDINEVFVFENKVEIDINTLKFFLSYPSFSQIFEAYKAYSLFI